MPNKDLLALVVESDLDQPDMAEITFASVGEQYVSQCKDGDPVVVKAGMGTPEDIFHGEVVGLEPTYEAGGDTRFVIRAFNKLHRLVRGRKSKTYENMSDQDIVQQIAGNAGLQAQCDSSTKITHPHVYQHNQTDLEFVRSRAARIDYEVLCDDTKLYFRKRQTDNDSGIVCDMQQNSPYWLQKFSARLSSAGVVNEVNVRGWDPDKKKEIVGKAKASGSRLGSNAAGDVVKKGFGQVLTFESEYPIFSQEEADALAKSALDSRLMTYITADCQCMGSPKFKAGTVVKIKVADKRFSGKYYVAAVSHRYFHGHGMAAEEGGYRTMLSLQRDAEG
jgi:phage protein D